MPIQVTLVFDSGTFLDGSDKNGHVDLGYFKPCIVVHADGEEKKTIRPGQIGYSGGIVEVRHEAVLKDSSKDLKTGITASACLGSHILRLPDLYDEHVEVDASKFHCIFRFLSGHFCCSKPKIRDFKEIDQRYAPTQRRKPIGPIAHDLVVHYLLEENEAVILRNGEYDLWSTADHPDIQQRFDIEILADNWAADLFYCHALTKARASYWVPNQGDPPPSVSGSNRLGAGESFP